MAQDPDPIGNGFVASLARPGGNITGLATLAPEISGKQLELLKEIVPKLSRVAVFGTSTNPGDAQRLREVELPRGVRGVLQYLEVLGPKDIETASEPQARARPDALVMPGPTTMPITNTARRPRGKKPTPGDIFQPEYIEAGGLMYLRRETLQICSGVPPPMWTRF